MDRFGFIIFVIGYLEKGASRVSGTLKQREENSFGQYTSLSSLKLGHLAINNFV
jgi:hypothetical protein